jgi:hypothetical protein
MLNRVHVTDAAAGVGSSTIRRQTPQPAAGMLWDIWTVDSQDDCAVARGILPRTPKIPTVLLFDEAPRSSPHNRLYRWLLKSEQSGGSIVLAVMNASRPHSGVRRRPASKTPKRSARS